MMKNLGYWMVSCIAALGGGCGGIPELLIESVQDSAKEVVEENIDGLVEDLVGDILDTDQLPSLLSEDEESVEKSESSPQKVRDR